MPESLPHEADVLCLAEQVSRNTGDIGLVVCRPDGTPWPPDQFSAEFHTFARRRGFAIRFHDLRHTHASNLLRDGVPVNLVSQRLGHAEPAITLNVYSHVLPGMQEEAAAKIDEMMEQVLGGAA
ncbi:MAG TPA: tyrosine-type recombinase/integrase [Coriobacteriia bacterium]|nr:tyrosine-type recombinase/integrase [Coriobacteriia bacterium]